MKRSTEMNGKRIRWSILFMVTALVATAVTAQASEREWVEKTFRESMTVSVKAVTNASFSGVFQKNIYDIKYTMFADNESFSPGSEYRAFAGNDRLVPVVKPETNMKLTYFEGLINPDFKLNKESASSFMAALKGLFGDWFFDKVKGKSIRKVNDGWQFLTGTFYGHLKGFVVSVDQNGHIMAVHYNLKL